MSLLNIDSCTDNSLCLHLSDLRIGNSQTAATMSHHWVELMKCIADSFDLFNSLALCVSQFLNIFFLSRNELMQRRIQETDGNWVAFQSFVQLLEISLLLR